MVKSWFFISIKFFIFFRNHINNTVCFVLYRLEGLGAAELRTVNLGPFPIDNYGLAISFLC